MKQEKHDLTKTRNFIDEMIEKTGILKEIMIAHGLEFNDQKLEVED